MTLAPAVAPTKRKNRRHRAGKTVDFAKSHDSNKIIGANFRGQVLAHPDISGTGSAQSLWAASHSCRARSAGSVSARRLAIARRPERTLPDGAPPGWRCKRRHRHRQDETPPSPCAAHERLLHRGAAEGETRPCRPVAGQLLIECGRQSQVPSDTGDVGIASRVERSEGDAACAIGLRHVTER